MAHLLRYPSQLPMRPINKEMEAVELDQLFESYVETDLFQQLTTPAADPSGSDDLAHLFDLPSSNESDLFGFTPILHRESEPWHKATQLSSQNPSSSSDSVGSSVSHSHLRGKSTSSDSDTLSFEDLFELERNQLRSTSQPSTPRPTTVTSTSTTSKCIKKAQSVPSISRGVQKSLKKCPSSSFAKTAKMMQPAYYRAPVPHMWARKMDSAVDLHAHVLPINMHSPPPSTKISQDECADGFFVQHHHHQPYTTTRSPMVEGGSSPDMGFSNYQLTPQASPAIGVSSSSDPFAQNMGLTYSSTASSAALSAFTPPSSLRLPMTTWAPSDSPAMEFPYSTCSSDFSTTKTAGWWNDDTPVPHRKTCLPPWPALWPVSASPATPPPSSTWTRTHPTRTCTPTTQHIICKGPHTRTTPQTWYLLAQHALPAPPAQRLNRVSTAAGHQARHHAVQHPPRRVGSPASPRTAVGLLAKEGMWVSSISRPMIAGRS
jgi:hypothetical protein